MLENLGTYRPLSKDEKGKTFKLFFLCSIIPPPGMESSNRKAALEIEISKLLTERYYLMIQKRAVKVIPFICMSILIFQLSKPEEEQSWVGMLIASIGVLISMKIIEAFGDKLNTNKYKTDMANINIKLLMLPPHANKTLVSKQLMKELKFKSNYNSLCGEIQATVYFIGVLIIFMLGYLIWTQLYYSLGFRWYDWLVYPTGIAIGIWLYISIIEYRKQRNLLTIDWNRLTEQIKEARQDPLGLYENSKRPGQIVKR